MTFTFYSTLLTEYVRHLTIDIHSYGFPRHSLCESIRIPFPWCRVDLKIIWSHSGFSHWKVKVIYICQMTLKIDYIIKVAEFDTHKKHPRKLRYFKNHKSRITKVKYGSLFSVNYFFHSEASIIHVVSWGGGVCHMTTLLN